MVTTYTVVMAVLILFSAYFSATETAFSSMNRTRLRTLADKGSRSAERALKLADQYDKLISAILIGNNIVNIATASIGTVLFVSIYGDLGATISTVVVTIVVLIFGEITPKSIAKDCPEKFAMFSAPFMRLLMWLFVPLTILFSGWKKLIAKVLHLQPNEKMSQEELLTLVEEVQQSGSIDEEESELLHNAIEFSDCAAEDILTHRVDLEAVSVEDSKERIASSFTQSRYSRLLVYNGTIDNIVGVIHQKDFYTGTGVTERKVEDILSPVMYVNEQAKIKDILPQMQKEKVHVAVVLDEFGGTYGIITMEDILEELVGEIWDEHDEVTEVFQKLENDRFRVDASVDMDDFFEFFQLRVETESATLGSWVVEMLNRVPREGDAFHCGSVQVTVSSVHRHRVVAVEVACTETVETEQSTAFAAAAEEK